MDFGAYATRNTALSPRDSGPLTHIAQLDIRIPTRILRLSERKTKTHFDRF